MEKTKEALQILITGESNAVKAYEGFANKAYEDNLSKTGLLFTTLAMAERIHIKNHLSALGTKFVPELDEEIIIGSTIDNVKTAYSNELHEARSLYSQLIKSIKKECNDEYGKVARLSMVWAQKVEKEHAGLLRKTLKALKKGKNLSFDHIYFCQVCGNIVLDNESKKECIVCGHDIHFFKERELGVN